MFFLKRLFRLFEINVIFHNEKKSHQYAVCFEMACHLHLDGEVDNKIEK